MFTLCSVVIVVNACTTWRTSYCCYGPSTSYMFTLQASQVFVIGALHANCKTWLHKNLYRFYFLAASALKCYKCKGPDDGRPYPKSICEDEQTEVTCSSENYTCGKYHHEIKSGALINEVEARSCVADCRYIELSCRAIILAGGECTFSCCDEDLCNTVTRLTSHLFLTAGAFVSAAVYLYKF